MEKGVDIFDPDRTYDKIFSVVLRSDYSQCPNKVKRCESCRYPFAKVDQIVVKTTGEREYYDKKKNKRVKQLGNVYLLIKNSNFQIWL